MNKNILISGAMFLTGAALGSGITFVLCKKYYNERNEKEIESMREYFKGKYDPEVNSSEETEKEEASVEKKTVDIQNDSENTREEDDEEDTYEEPHVMEEAVEFWEQDYPVLQLTYYEGDDVLADEANKMIRNVEELVGTDFKNHFGDHKDDTVFVQNDKLQVYYEITLDRGEYADYVL